MSQPNSINDVDFTELLTPAEVARLFAVDPKTVTRWANEGRLSTIRTLGNPAVLARRGLWAAPVHGDAHAA